jgi:glutamate/aspartate transport system substrate-binding protein
VVTKGTTSEKMLRQMNDERVLKLTLLEAKDHDESFRAVEEGKAVAFPMDDVLLYGLISKSGRPQDFAVVGKYLSVEPYAIMMRRDEPQRPGRQVEIDHQRAARFGAWQREPAHVAHVAFAQE